VRPGRARALHPWLGLALSLSFTAAHAAAYRCDDAGRITYTNLPCPSGRQTEIVDRAPTPSEQDRAAAEARQRSQRAQLTVIEQGHERERAQDAKAAALAACRNAGRGKELAACSKLALRAKRAREDLDVAPSRDRTAQRARLRRADDDYAALCRKR